MTFRNCFQTSYYFTNSQLMKETNKIYARLSFESTFTALAIFTEDNGKWHFSNQTFLA